MRTSTSVAARLIVMLHQGNDPLGINRMDGGIENRLIRDAVAEAFSGREGPVRDALRRHASLHERMPVSRITAEMLRHSGVDPFALSVLAHSLLSSWNTTFTIDPSDPESRGSLVMVSHKAGAYTGSLRLGPGAVWMFDGRIRLELPETVVFDLRGRALAEVVSHPVLDTIPMRIVGPSFTPGVYALAMPGEWGHAMSSTDVLREHD